MKKLLLTLALLLAPSLAWGQCSGVFNNNTVCGNATGSSNTPRMTPATSLPSGPITVGSTAIVGGVNGGVLYNNAQVVGTNALNPNIGTFGSTSVIPIITINAQGLITAVNTAGFSAFNPSIRVVTSNDSIVAADCGKIIQLGTGATGKFTETLPSISGFSTPCTIKITNADTGSGKILSGFPTGFTASAILWPGQTGEVSINSAGTAWITTINPSKYQLTNQVVLQVNHASGTATANDCLTTGAGACATIQQAINLAYANFNGNCQGQLIIQNAVESFTESGVFLSGPLPNFVCNNDNQSILILGDPVTPANVVWNTTTYAIEADLYANIRINGFKCTGTGANNCLTAAKYGLITFENMEFGSGLNYDLIMFEYGSIYFDGGEYLISGTTRANHINCSTEGHYIAATNSTISIPNAVTSSGPFINFVGACGAQIVMTFSGSGSGTGWSGGQWSLVGPTFISKSSSTIPGNAGSNITAAGGVAF